MLEVKVRAATVESVVHAGHKREPFRERERRKGAKRGEMQAQPSTIGRKRDGFENVEQQTWATKQRCGKDTQMPSGARGEEQAHRRGRQLPPAQAKRFSRSPSRFPWKPPVTISAVYAEGAIAWLQFAPMRLVTEVQVVACQVK